MAIAPIPAKPLERAKHFRYRAEELRTIANEWIDIGTREMLGRVARDYEQMAEMWEKQTTRAVILDD